MAAGLHALEAGTAILYDFSNRIGFCCHSMFFYSIAVLFSIISLASSSKSDETFIIDSGISQRSDSTLWAKALAYHL